MAYFATALCGQCRQPFNFNPALVPSLNNVPFCRNCVEIANPKRVAGGLAPIAILPGAYDIVPEETDNDRGFVFNEEYYDDPNNGPGDVEDFEGEEYIDTANRFIDDEEPMTPYEIDDEVDRDDNF
jgi:hypothetical protein